MTRVLLLLGFLALVAAIDKVMKGREANRWREYLVLLGCGLAGSLTGVLHDQITVTISPEYYRLGKGLVEDNLRWGAVILGAKAGFTAGVIIGGFHLLSVKDRLCDRQLVRFILIVAACAALSALMGAAVGNLIVPDSWIHFFDVPKMAARNFKIVAGEHYGLYFGALVGTVAAMVDRRIYS